MNTGETINKTYSINDVITDKYDDLHKLCQKNTIRQIEVQYRKNMQDIEDEDMLHTELIKLLKKYKDVEFATLDDGYTIIKDAFLKEKNLYSKMEKPATLKFIPLILKDDEIEFRCATSENE